MAVDHINFGEMVGYMDKSIGRIVRALDKLGLRENTLLMFTADNGTNTDITSILQDGTRIQGGKRLTTDAGTHVPLIANWKGVTQGKVCEDLVDFSDFLPTIADAGGASLARCPTIDGRSFLPQILGEKGSPRDWVFCWYRKTADDPLKRFARERRWKLYDDDYSRNGDLYDVPNDPLERCGIRLGQGEQQAECPIISGQVEQQAAEARARLQVVLDSMP